MSVQQEQVTLITGGRYDAAWASAQVPCVLLPWRKRRNGRIHGDVQMVPPDDGEALAAAARDARAAASL